MSRWNQPGKHLFWGVFLVIMGGIFLLGNMGFVDPHHVFEFWPVIFIMMGVSRIIANDAVVPLPRLRVDRLSDGTQQPQRLAGPCLYRLFTFTHERANRGRR